jgi:hypothetical protein
MNQYIHLVSWNKLSYFNKIYAVPFSNASSYKKNASAFLSIANAVNFNPNDGLTTKLVLNIEEVPYNYLLVTNENGSTINSRWFILRKVRTRIGQYELSLVRDVISDNYAGVRQSSFILKKSSYIAPMMSEAQYKKTMQFSQIKTSETLLGEADGCKGYLAIYTAKNMSEHKSVTAITNQSGSVATISDTIMKDIIEHAGNTYGFCRVNSLALAIDSYTYDSKKYLFHHWYNESDINSSGYPAGNTCAITQSAPNLVPLNPYDDNNGFITMMDTYASKETTKTLALAMITNEGLSMDENTLTLLDSIDGKTVTGTTSPYNRPYTVHVTKTDAPMLYNLTDADRTAVADALKFSNLSKSTFAKHASWKYNLSLYQVTLEEAPDTGTGAYCDDPFPAGMMTTTDSVYDVHLIPLGGQMVVENKTISVNSGNMFSFASKLFETYGSNIYDIQWLPYGYDAQRFESDTINVGSVKGTSFTAIRASESTSSEYVGAIIHLSRSSAGMTVYRDIIPSNSSDLMENRIENETTFYRLCSPNWTSTFEFRPIYNNGLHGFQIDVSFKPYTPYIRVCPMFSNLYGSTFNDTRGLVLSGDFSIDQTTDAWTTYKLNNKNYELIFNRDIQSLDLRNSVADIQDSYAMVGDIAGTASGAVSAGAYGTMMSGGNPAVGIATGVASLGAGVVDSVMNAGIRKLNRSIRADNRQATIDKYQYQIGNIKAMPISLTKTSSFDKSYRVYPVLEKYTCTDIEKERLRESIEVNGIEIGKYCTMKDATAGATGRVYLSASLIRWSGDETDENVITAISDVLNDGIYMEVS